MMITERQGEILNGVIREYIDQAQPVSSKWLEKKHDFGVSPATIRNEMQKLTEFGYISQPHTSAGRIPTDKGYRFFVDKLFDGLQKDLGDFEMDSDIHSVTRFLASQSSGLALGYLSAEKILWKEGWQEIFEEPEFEEPGFAASFARMIDDFEENIEEIFSPEIRVYIGKENPVSRVKDFSIIAFGFEGGLLAIVGPKRMSYHKNIELFNRLWQKTQI